MTLRSQESSHALSLASPLQRPHSRSQVLGNIPEHEWGVRGWGQGGQGSGQGLGLELREAGTPAHRTLAWESPALRWCDLGLLLTGRRFVALWVLVSDSVCCPGGPTPGPPQRGQVVLEPPLEEEGRTGGGLCTRDPSPQPGGHSPSSACVSPFLGTEGIPLVGSPRVPAEPWLWALAVARTWGQRGPGLSKVQEVGPAWGTRELNWHLS